MTDHGLSALVVPSADPHQSEYVAEHWQARQWISGFTGSAGTAVVTRDRAGLWTDFRYWIQAEAQLKDSGFELFRQGEPDTPAVDAWLAKILEAGDTIALAGDLFSRSQVKGYLKTWEGTGLKVETGLDPVAELWENRPAMPASPAYDFKISLAGESREDKLGRIRKKMVKSRADYYLITRLEEIAWALNLRGADVDCTPVNIAFALIGLEAVSLFMDKAKLDEGLEAALARAGVECLEYGAVIPALEALPAHGTVLLDPASVNVRLWDALPESCKKVEVKVGPVEALKARKNGVEVNHLSDTLVRDGAAMVSFLHWLETQVASGKRITEVQAGDQVKEFRAAQDGFVDNSFNPIMAQGAHSAMCHYSADAASDARISTQGLFLTDSGGQYLTGTTDITRTLCFGEPTRAQKRDYTLVMKGHIAVATARFPAGTRGCQLDTLARQALWQAGMDFGHGTGHGVGFFLSVHEGPARISPFPVDVALEPGMVITNEPGLYREGEYGIRLENMVLVKEDLETVFGKFNRFDTLTLCHFERALLDTALMTPAEIQWVNDYHARVFESLSPLVEDSLVEWLRAKTQPL